MSHTMIGRRMSAMAPMLPSPFLPSPRFPSLTSPAQDRAKRVDAMVRQTLDSMPELPMVDWYPAIGVSENRNEFTVTAELPGVTATEVTVDYRDRVLTISGEKKDANHADTSDRRWHAAERSHGSFQRAVPLPGGIAEDRIAAELADGVLTVHLPKSDEWAARYHRIPIIAK